jgi:hypothetical protein
MGESANALMCSNARVAGHVLLPGHAYPAGQSSQAYPSQARRFREPEYRRGAA